MTHKEVTATMEGLRPNKLDNSLIEMCVVVGMDQDTGLVPTNTKERMSTGSNDKQLALFKSSYKPFVLAALSGETAVFSHTTAEVDGMPFYAAGSVTSTTPVKKSKKNPRRVSTCPGLGAAMLPVSHEVITSLPPLCLPDGGQVFHEPRESTVHYLVLTDIEGNRTYGCCLKIYKPYLTKENENIPGQYDLIFSDPECDEEVCQDSSCVQCYVPLCCCIISKFPYFSIFKDCLSRMIPNLQMEARMFRSGLMQFISQLAMVPIPPPGTLAIEFNLSGQSYTIRPVDGPEKRIIDIELHNLFLCFSLDDILSIITCVLTQQRLVFMSSKYSMLTLIIESIFALIQPLSWSWTYVPVLPDNLVDMTEAPGVYILGCHISLLPHIQRAMNMQEMEDIIIVNIDEGTVEIGIHMETLPRRATDPFKASLKKVSPMFDLYTINRPSFVTLQDMKIERDQFITEFNNTVLSASMEMMARILSDMLTYQETSFQGETFFDMDAFIESKPPEDRDFYKVLCETHAFSSFLEERLHNPEKRNSFTATMDKIKPQLNRQGPLRKRSSSVNPAKAASSISLDDQVKETTPLTTFTLPPFNFEGLHTGSYYDACLTELSTAIENLDIKSSHLMANYLYLRGMFKVARGNRIDGLDDLFALLTRNMQLFPKSFICQVLTELAQPEQAELHSRSFYPEASRIKNLKKEKEYLDGNRIRVTTSAIPSSPLDQTEFVKRVTMLQITDSSQSAERLFEVLKNKTNRLVDPDEFSNFYRSLQETDRIAQSINLTGITAERGESVILVSSWLRTSTASGRLIATNHRLVFMHEGSHKCETVVHFKDIQDVENYQHYNVIPPGVASLKITSRVKSSTPFIVCLKEDRNFWNDCIYEMIAGCKIAEETKDYQTIKQAAQNVIVADALRGSDRIESITKVLYLKNISEIESKKLSPETKKMLIRRIDPTPQADETQKSTIEAMVFAPESEEDGNEAEVWCGLGSGTVVAIDTTTWNIVSVLRHARGRVSCLESVDKNHIWIGSMDATIYIVNRKTKQADQQLHNHHDYISHITKTEEDDGSITVWSASLEGLIIGWDPVSLIPKKTIKLNGVKTMTSVVAIGNAFWCVTRNAVLVVDRDSDGSDFKTLSCNTGSGVARSIDCMCAIAREKQVQQVWTACDKRGIIALWDTITYDHVVREIDCKGFTQMLFVDGKVWGGGRDGTIYIINVEDVSIEQTLQLHKDRIRSICPTDTSFILTGPGSSDGRIAVWRSHILAIPDSNDDFEFVDKTIIKMHNGQCSGKRQRKSCKK